MFNKNTITRFDQLETPFYYYDLNILSKTLAACRTASSKYGFHVHYAMKANFNPRVLDTIQSYGFGADCVSGNEVKAAIEHGFGKEKVVFAGVGKSDKEINAALDADIFCFNAESVQELFIINDLAKPKTKKPISLFVSTLMLTRTRTILLPPGSRKTNSASTAGNCRMWPMPSALAQTCNFWASISILARR